MKTLMGVGFVGRRAEAAGAARVAAVGRVEAAGRVGAVGRVGGLRRSAGFSLLEIMVVIAIIGLIASLILPNVIGAGEQADKQKARTDIVSLENALSQYRLDNGQYPTTEQGLEALLREPQVDPRPRNYRRNGYINRLPLDPWNQEYLLLSPGEFGDVDVFSAGPDKTPGTADDIGNWNLENRGN